MSHRSANEQSDVENEDLPAIGYPPEQLNAVQWEEFGMAQENIEGLEKQFYKEVGEGHVLYGIAAKAIARAGGSDDVLFELLDAEETGTNRVAEVHLTWRLSGPDTPPWPQTILYDSLQSWVDEMTELNTEVAKRRPEYERLETRQRRMKRLIYPRGLHLGWWLLLAAITLMLLTYAVASWIASQ